MSLHVCELSPGLAAARQGAKKYLELTPEDKVADAEAAYAHLVDVLERSVVHAKFVLAGCLLGLLKIGVHVRQMASAAAKFMPTLCVPTGRLLHK